MRCANPFPLVLAELRGQRGLAWVVVVLVATALAAGIAVTAQERALRLGSARAADDFDLLVGAPGSTTQLVLTSVYLQPQALPLLDGEVLRRMLGQPQTRWVAPLAMGDNWQGQPIVGTTADFATRGGTLPLQQGRTFARRGEVVVGASVPLQIGQTLTPSHGIHTDTDGDDASGEHHEHAGARYVVVGRAAVRHNVWDRAILVPIEDVWAVHGLASGHSTPADAIGPPWLATTIPGVTAISVKPATVAAAYQLRQQFRDSRSTAVFPAEVLNDLYLLLGNVRDLMAALAAVTQALVVAAVLAALLVGLLARRQRYAVLRALGASRGLIFAIVWLQVLALVLIGTVLGVALGWVGTTALSHWMEGQLGFALPVALGASELRLIAALLVASAGLALVPAWLVFRQPVAEGLRAS